MIYCDYAIRLGPFWHNIPLTEEWPGVAEPIGFRLSADAPLRRVRRPRCPANRGGRRVRTDVTFESKSTDVTSHLNTRPVSRCHGCGCPLPVTEFVAQRCPLVMEAMCRKPGWDDNV